ncbi:hypothetical protein ABS71_02095 [bacterium SCN 62-11]|nr:hypothetical protein [Candidatus Eremiobacteraeota bacterium]ODT78141.1 MAG: hypothetical protein ABS71_02095 [bacterium SCN 62-11]
MTPSYLLAFRILPRLFHSDMIRTREALVKEDLLRKLWVHAGLHLGVRELPAPPTWETFGEVLLISMPAPQEPPEAYFLAVIGHQPQVYTLEMGQDQDTYFCGVTPEGHQNYGKGCLPEAGAFLAALAGIR